MARSVKVNVSSAWVPLCHSAVGLCVCWATLVQVPSEALRYSVMVTSASLAFWGRLVMVFFTLS